MRPFITSIKPIKPILPINPIKLILPINPIKLILPIKPILPIMPIFVIPTLLITIQQKEQLTAALFSFLIPHSSFHTPHSSKSSLILNAIASVGVELAEI